MGIWEVLALREDFEYRVETRSLASFYCVFCVRLLVFFCRERREDLRAREEDWGIKAKHSASILLFLVNVMLRP